MLFIIVTVLCRILSSVHGLCEPDTNVAFGPISDTELSALKDIYDSTNGPLWNFCINCVPWNFTDPNPCVDGWEGIACKIVEEVTYVYQISLSSMALNGTLPLSIGNFPQLCMLLINTNSALSGWIPKEIGSLTQLQSLDLSSNNLIGTIPPEIGRMLLLEELKLYLNPINGTIPNELCELKHLETLELYLSQLTGTIPSHIGSMTSLTELDLYSNLLVGSLPEELCWLVNLQTLMISDNQLTGSIPQNIGNLTQMTELTIDFNKMNGTIPASFSNMTKMLYMYLDDNDFSGSLPPDLGKMQTLYIFHFSNTKIGGRLPESLGTIKRLQDLYAPWNQLTGPIPPGLVNTSITQIDLTYNQLSQHIPNIFSRGISQVRLSNNKLSGPLPDVMYSTTLVLLELENNLLSQHLPVGMFSESSRLYSIKLDNNRFTGPIPDTITQLTQCADITMDDNQLSGSLPDDFSALSRYLMTLSLSNNHLTGSIPSAVGHLSNQFQNMMLSNNHLTGVVPSDLSVLKGLIVLGLNENILTGTLPSGLSRLVSLTIFFVYQNSLSGSLSEVFNSLTQSDLFYVDVSNNQFTGNIPSEVFHIVTLNSFAAVGNCLSGSIPEDICGADNLTSLALDGLMSASSCQMRFFPAWTSSYGLPNAIKGGFPDCLFSMKRLESLHLSGNGLTGSIHSDVVIGHRLSDLSLSHNNLKGVIPPQIQSHNWSNLDLSYNKFRGTLDGDIYSLYGMNGSLSLQVNRMSGKIPSSLRTAEAVTILDGNLFACNAERSDLPKHDSYSDIYECGSNTFNFTMYFWVAVVLLSGLGFLVLVVAAKYSPKTIAEMKRQYDKWMQVFSDQSGKLSNITALGDFVKVLRGTSMIVTLVILLVCLPVYLVLSEYYDSYTYEYAWRTTACYLSGEVSGGVLVVLFTVFGGVMVHSYRQWKKCIDVNPVADGVDEELVKSSSSWTYSQNGLVSLIVLFNIVLVTTINILYVYVDHNFSSGIVRVTQLSVALFKIVWKNLIVRLLLSVTGLAVTKSKDRDDRGEGSSLTESGNESTAAAAATKNENNLSLAVFVTIFNNIAAPFIATCYVSTNCFYNVFSSPPKVVVSYEYAMCTYGLFNGNFTPCTVFLDSTTHSTSYDPPFIYSYQCSSTFITTYSSIYVFMFTMEAFFIPLVMWCLAWYHHKYGGSEHKGCGDRLEQVILVEAALIPKILQSPIRDSSIFAERLSSSDVRKRVPYFECAVFTVKLLNMFSILCTFGVVLPPVAVVCCVAVLGSTVNMQLLIGRFVTLCQDSRNDLVEGLNEDCRHAGSMFLSSVWMLTPFTVVFFALLLFDVVGDSVGWKKALWGPLLVILGSTATAAWLMLRSQSCVESPARTKSFDGFARRVSADGYSVLYVKSGEAEYSPLDTDADMNKALKLSDRVQNI